MYNGGRSDKIHSWPIILKAVLQVRKYSHTENGLRSCHIVSYIIVIYYPIHMQIYAELQAGVLDAHLHLPRSGRSTQAWSCVLVIVYSQRTSQAHTKQASVVQSSHSHHTEAHTTPCHPP